MAEESYLVDVFHDGEEGLYWALINNYDLIILDIMLPKKNGFEICKTLRKRKISTPILMLTARDSVEDKVIGLNEGADDYLTKPFAFEEFLARVKALMRRNQNDKNKILTLSDLELDTISRKVRRKNCEIELTGKEYSLLEYLMRNQNRIITETMILSHVWDTNFDPESNIIKVFIHHLRAKIDHGFDEQLLQTVRGMGYIMKSSKGL